MVGYNEKTDKIQLSHQKLLVSSRSTRWRADGWATQLFSFSAQGKVCVNKYSCGMERNHRVKWLPQHSEFLHWLVGNITPHWICYNICTSQIIMVRKQGDLWNILYKISKLHSNKLLCKCVWSAYQCDLFHLWGSICSDWFSKLEKPTLGKICLFIYSAK